MLSRSLVPRKKYCELHKRSAYSRYRLAHRRRRPFAEIDHPARAPNLFAAAQSEKFHLARALNLSDPLVCCYPAHHRPFLFSLFPEKSLISASLHRTKASALKEPRLSICRPVQLKLAYKTKVRNKAHALQRCNTRRTEPSALSTCSATWKPCPADSLIIV